MNIPLSNTRQPRLTPREIEVTLTWIASGSKAIAARRLHLAEPTVRAHIANVREKYSAVERSAHTKSDLLLCFLEDGHLHSGFRAN
ncbi:Bacterial regulatory protein, LuxR family [Corynebacterium faecale]|uniref:LuxR C-terminal-related transcriptional regulator n=1 Tax=Corynebacterium faecale TaxID=1758466 RepID=UPI0025B60EE2|nr:LuxR C-terminal-related transcriptional regulator [Corynebacterium faecale]WJY90978.1 Bacterial regulatory protein, LuxR family [Corynebacterium faecale]